MPLNRWTPGPCACQCDEEECEGTVCVSLTAPCDDQDRWAVSIKVLDDLGGTVGEVNTTNPYTGPACVNVPAGVYKVTATKTDCDPIVWEDVTVSCNATTNLSGAIRCVPYTSWRVRVFGCGNLPLPGATVKLTHQVSGTASIAETDADGYATVFASQLGTYDLTIDKERFVSYWTAFSQIAACDGGNLSNVSMSPEEGYLCCTGAFHELIDSPIPLPETLRITDAGGSFWAPITGGVSECVGGACVEREMQHVAIEGDGCSMVSKPCLPSGTHLQPPATGTAVTRVKYGFQLTGSPLATQTIPERISPFLTPQPPYPSLCTVPIGQLTRSRWRCVVECEDEAPAEHAYGSTGYMINNPSPLNITFYFPPDSGEWGPWPELSPPAETGGAYSSSIVISEF